MYPGRRRRAEGQGAEVAYGWPGSDSGGAGTKEAAGCRRRGDGEATSRAGAEGQRRAVAIKLRKKRVNVLRYARVRLLLPCPYSTSLDLSLGLFPGRRSR